MPRARRHLILGPLFRAHLRGDLQPRPPPCEGRRRGRDALPVGSPSFVEKVKRALGLGVGARYHLIDMGEGSCVLHKLENFCWGISDGENGSLRPKNAVL